MTATATKPLRIEPQPSGPARSGNAPPRDQLRRMATAANEVVACISELHAAGSNLVLDVLRHGDDFTEWEHYPADDACDPVTHARYYLHAHSPDDRERADYAHFHAFMDVAGLPDHLRRKIPEAGGPIHLIAISMTPDGMPERLFTTNRWVTDESWYPAADVIAMLDRFIMTRDQPSRPLNRWLNAMIVLFRPQIEDLLRERDRIIANWRPLDPSVSVLEDRRLEVTSAMAISLMQQIAWLELHLDG
ncbi:hypothetical protein ACVIJ6_006511 [Bradyrhizobium sp. USDA 4369]